MTEEPRKFKKVDRQKPKIEEEFEKEDKTEDVPLMIYEKDFGRPYTADYLKLEDIYKENIDNSQEKVSSIELWVKGEMLRKDIKQTTHAANRLLKEIEQSLNISEDTDRISRLNRLHQYFKYSMNSNFGMPVKFGDLPLKIKETIING